MDREHGSDAGFAQMTLLPAGTRVAGGAAELYALLAELHDDTVADRVGVLEAEDRGCSRQKNRVLVAEDLVLEAEDRVLEAADSG